MIQLIKRTLLFIIVSGASLALTGCDNVAVYGSISVGSSWGGYHGGGYHGGYGSPRMGSSVTISGRIR